MLMDFAQFLRLPTGNRPDLVVACSCRAAPFGAARKSVPSTVSRFHCFLRVPTTRSQVWVCAGYVFMTTQATSNVKGVSRFQATIESQGSATCSQATSAAMEVVRFQATIERQGCVRCSQEIAILGAGHVLFDPSPLWHPEHCSVPAYGMGMFSVLLVPPLAVAAPLSPTTRGVLGMVRHPVFSKGAASSSRLLPEVGQTSSA